jgi:hypothetical protein
MVHRADMTVGKDGYWTVAYCASGIDIGKYTHRTRAFLNTESTNSNVGDEMEPGYAGFLGTYEVPRWTEVHLHSATEFCTVVF